MSPPRHERSSRYRTPSSGAEESTESNKSHEEGAEREVDGLGPRGPIAGAHHDKAVVQQPWRCDEHFQCAAIGAPAASHASVTRCLSRVAARMALDERAVRATRQICSAHEAITRPPDAPAEEVAQAVPAGESGMARTWFRLAVGMLQVSSAEVVRLVRTGRAASSWWWSWRWSLCRLGSWRAIQRRGMCFAGGQRCGT